ncbi:MAG TPA: response regulator, partial [Gemmatimonadaceae bacterium]|nr:response regulator [Gemmatimonadaceae bacterium]
MPLRRSWQSLDRKLPLLASGLVLLTAATLGWTAYHLFERALMDRAGARLVASARIVSQVILRPRVRDSASRVLDRTLLDYLRGQATRDAAIAALAQAQRRRDTMNFHSALLDTAGRVLLDAHRGAMAEPAWASVVVAQGVAKGAAVRIGPVENVAGVPVISTVYPLRDTTRASIAPVAYVAESWAIASGRSARLIRDMIGSGITMVMGQPGEGAWTDLEHIVPAPPVQALADTLVDVDGSLAASWPVAGTRWVVWLSQPKRSVLAPTRTLLLTMFPLGVLIALVGAAIMWRMARGITRPLAQLTRAVEGVAQDIEPMPRTREFPSALHHDEISRLRVAFERMALRIADREALELQLRHAQKMEAIGRLAGGVAHDFNNLLTAIRSYADLMLDDMPEWDPKHADVMEIRRAAQRATDLTAQLLAFSRKQMLQPRVLRMATVLDDLQPMLRRLLIENIELVVEMPAELWCVRADRGQLEQVVVNLAVNARDAMPDGGILLIRAWNEVVRTPLETRHGVIPPGEYVAIAVNDTGTGMDDATQAQAFEPFFTTKSVGKGTGLGLATVHGIVAQSGGHVTLQSSLGTGTIFTVYLPRERDENAASRDSGPVTARSVQDAETVLLVEDEAAVRALARRVLQRAGYQVLDAATPQDAIRIAGERRNDITLVVSDVVMPQMSGPQLVERLRELCPRARVLYISGYTDDEVIGRGLANAATSLLQKPFSAQQLVQRV